MKDSNELGDLIGRTYEVLERSGVLWHLVKFDHLTTSFIHFTTAGITAYKLAQIVQKVSESISTLRELINKLEEETHIFFETYCYLVNLLHDYEKLGSNPKVRDVDELADNILKSFRVPKHTWELIKQDAKSVEAGVSQLGMRHHDLVVTICHIADVLASQDSVFALRTLISSNQTTARKLRQLESLGIKLGILHISSHRLFTILRSKDILNLFEERGWLPLLAYRDGVIFVGTKGSSKIPLEEIARLFASEIYRAIYKIEHARAEINRAVPKSFLNFVGYIAEALVEELPKDRDVRRPHLVILANKLAKAVRGELSVIESKYETLDETKRGVQSFQKSLLPAGRRPLERIAKELPLEELLGLIKEYVREIERDKATNVARLSYFIAGWSKEGGRVAKLYKLVFKEEPPATDILTLTLAVITKVFQYVENGEYEELVKLYEDGFRDFLRGREEKWKYEVYYYVSSYISGDIVEPLKITFPETDKKCILCRSPVFSEEPLQLAEYGSVLGAARGVQQVWTNDDIPLADKDKYTQSTEETAKYTRSMCTLCKYEATIISKALTPRGKVVDKLQREKAISLPAIAVYFRPAIAPEVLSFIAQNIEGGIEEIDLAEIYGRNKEGRRKRRVKPLLPVNIIPNYLGAFVIFSYKESISSRDSGKVLRTADLSGRRDQVYYGLLLIPELAKRAGGGQFKICLSLVDLMSPPEKLIELPFAVRFVEELNSIISYLQERVKDKRYRKLFLKLFSTSYYHVMRFLESVAIKLALWYDHTKVSVEKKTATWIIRGIEEIGDLPLSTALLTPPSIGFDKAENKKLIQRSVDLTYKRELYRPRFIDVYEIASEFEVFLSHVEKLMGGGRYV